MAATNKVVTAEFQSFIVMFGGNASNVVWPLYVSFSKALHMSMSPLISVRYDGGGFSLEYLNIWIITSRSAASCVPVGTSNKVAPL